MNLHKEHIAINFAQISPDKDIQRFMLQGSDH
ncbi:hypothetical protein JOD43_000574 [Pullulanibacillus pueri]|nr:hypothetical protein [Pullulanibacillus pueri]